MATPVPTLEFESLIHHRGETVVAIDEVGRGALAGPVMVGAVALSSLREPPRGVADSKVLTDVKRRALVDDIQQWVDGWAVGAASAAEIDAWGIRLALAVAAHRAVSQLTLSAPHCLIDGPHNILRVPMDVGFGVEPPPAIPERTWPATMVVKGDQRCASISAAAILAKVARDTLMIELAEQYPDFGWEGNKGYGSSGHLEALERCGATTLHRRSWNIPGVTPEK